MENLICLGDGGHYKNSGVFKFQGESNDHKNTINKPPLGSTVKVTFLT